MKIALEFAVFWVMGSAVLLGLAEGSMLPSYQENVKNQCSFARYPTLCVETLVRSGTGDKHIDMIYGLVNNTISETKLPVYDVPMLVSQYGVQHAQRAQYVTGDKLPTHTLLIYENMLFFVFVLFCLFYE